MKLIAFSLFFVFGWKVFPDSRTLRVQGRFCMDRKNIRVGIVEDNEAIRNALEQALGGEPDMELVFSAPSAEDAPIGRLWRRIDVGVVDLDLPGASGIDVIRAVYETNPALPLLVFTTLAEQESLFRALKAGARGYIVKSDGLDGILRALRGAAQGECTISPSIAGWIIDDLQRVERARSKPVERLSPRESTVLRLLAAGKIYKEIADELSISVHTAHAHIRKIYAKFHASGRSETLRKARILGHLPPESA